MTAPSRPRPRQHPYVTTHVYADGTETASTVRTRMTPEGMVTTVDGGPLHDSSEITSVGASPVGLRQQHHKWLWRVLNADRTHVEWFTRLHRRQTQDATVA